MDQYVNNRNVEILQKLLADPAEAGQYYSYNLQTLVGEYPQSGILRALLAHTNKENQENLHSASARFNSRLLYKLINAPESLQAISPEQVIFQSDGRGDRVFHSETLPEEAPQVIADSTPSITAVPEPAAELVAEPEPLHEPVAVQPEAAAEPEPMAEHLDEQETIAPVTDNQSAPVEEQPAVIEEIAPEPVHEPITDIKPEPTVEAPVEEAPVEHTHIENQSETLVEHTNVEDEPETPVVEDAAPEITPVEETISDETPVEAPQAETQAEPQEQPSTAAHQTTTPPVTDEPRRVTLEDLLSEPEPVAAPVAKTGSAIEDEVYDEITGIENVNLNNVPVAAKEDEVYEEIAGIENVDLSNPPVAEKKEEIKTVAVPREEVAADNKEDIKTQEDQLIVENMAATDFFVFEKVFDKSDTVTDPQPEPAPEPASYFTFEKELDQSIAAEQPVVNEQVSAPVPAQKAAPAEDDKQDVSKYFDDKLPYTFLWWLDKTRQEHADLYQPYATGSKSADIKTFGDPRLQQLYYESIFQVSPPEEIGKKPAAGDIEFDMTDRTDRIIGRFIKQDPQISTPSNEKLDNENKAKKSSEDTNEIVTETLAKIYTEQMLYHKAIATYKKLMLKFPEKSRYFADHIENLEKKIN